MAHKPVGTGQKLAVSGVASTSSPFAHQSNTIRVVSVGTSCHIAIGTFATATTSDYYIKSDGEATISCGRPSSQRVVGITTGTTTTIDFPEGTGAPFAAGDTVSLTVTGQDYFDFSHKPVQSIDNTKGVEGYYNTRLVVNADTSGVATAFASQTGWAQLRGSFEVGAITPGTTGTVYIQQVQVSGDA
tara:strand:- start:14 stop:574 length:561 start_codon:yes stop_codon:yes gene_type:complete